jgi:Holliday junction DNA helicase RuvA
MIAHISGKIAEKFSSSAIIDVHGVGYEVILSTPDFEQLNLDDPVKLYTFHHVREQSEELFGFSALAAKKLFELLITVQGVGPKAAMSILSLAPAEEVRNAIASSDHLFISRASGVGKKTAEAVVVHLKDKVGLPTAYTNAAPIAAQKDDALDALMALGYTLNDATAALEKIDPTLPTPERIRLALKN